MNLYSAIDDFMAALANFLWGTPLVILLLGGGFYFSIISRFVPFAYLRHGIDILAGKYDSDDDPGQITHFQALSRALSSTVGMGNIARVALPKHTGAPRARIWMTGTL